MVGVVLIASGLNEFCIKKTFRIESYIGNIGDGGNGNVLCTCHTAGSGHACRVVPGAGGESVVTFTRPSAASSSAY